MTLQTRIVRALKAAAAAAALAVIGTGYAVAQAVPTVTINAVASSPIAPATVTITWSSTNATACVASGDWSGPKLLSGTQTFTQVAAPRSYTLTCSAGSGRAVMSWTPPTEWTDGTAMPATEPGSYKLYHASMADNVPSSAPTTVAAPATSHTLTDLPAGLRHFGITAVSTEGVESDMSMLVTKTIVVPSASSTAVVTVRRKPKPPRIATVDAPTGNQTVVLPRQ